MIQIPDYFDEIKLLMSVSERVTEYMDTQNYLTDSSLGVDGLSERDIMNNCYEIIMDELEQKGIFFSSDIEDIYSSITDLHRVYDLYCWIDMSHQIDMCKTHKELVNRLEDIAVNQLSDEDLLVQWMTACAEPVSSTDRHLYNCLRLMPSIDTNENFVDYLNGLFDKVKDFNTEFTVPLHVITEFIVAMEEGRKRAYKAFRQLYNSDDNEIIDGMNKADVKKIEKDLSTYDLDKTMPLVISDYAWMWTIENGKGIMEYDDLPQSLKEKYDTLELEHHQSSPHHIEYYLAHKDIPFTFSSVFNIAVACLEEDKESTENKFNKVLEIGQDIWISHMELKKLFDHCKIVLSQYAEGVIA